MDKRVIFPRSLRYLIAIAEHGSFTKAASFLHVSQPSLSQKIKQLEGLLSCELFVRSRRNIRLTDAGETYLRHTLRAYNALESGARAIYDTQNLSQGSLRIGWTPITDYLTCPLVEQFSQQYPGIFLRTWEMPADYVAEAVAKDDIDIGIAFGSCTQLLSSTEIKANILFKENLYLAAGQQHQKSSQQQITTGELAQEKLVLLSPSFALRRSIDHYCHEHGIVPRIGVETDSLGVIVEFVRSNICSTILPQNIIQAQSGLQQIMLTPSLPPQEISLITRNKGYNSPASLAFTETAYQWATKRNT